MVSPLERKVMQAREMLLQLALLYEGDWEQIFNAVQNREYPETEIEYEGNYITIMDEDYPETLKQSYRPPFVLFYEGNINLLKDKKPKIAIGTSRHNQTEQKQLVEQILKGTSYTLILGGRSKVDEYIAQNTDNSLIVVAGTPISMVDSKFKNDKTLIISEYPEKTNPQITNFARRNQIISALCNKTLILHCEKTSGTNTLVMFSLQNGKEVMVVPASPFAKEEVINNELIYEGAIPVWTKHKLCEIMN